jgi:hypothetical protein
MPTDGLAQKITYHSAAALADETYNDETGNFAAPEGPVDRGALWFDDEDNSHWIAWMF